jgi:hypothetical protein
MWITEPNQRQGAILTSYFHKVFSANMRMFTMYFRIAASRLFETLTGTFIQPGPQRQRPTALERLRSASGGSLPPFDTRARPGLVSRAPHAGSAGGRPSRSAIRAR